MNSPTATTDPAVRAYADAVRASLDDLAPAVRDELLEDLEGHLAEVASEIDGELVDRLGPPTTYAEELRLSADLPPRPRGRTRKTSALRRAARDAISSQVTRVVSVVERTPGGPEALAFLPQLRPAWWVARGWLLVMAASIVTGGLLSSFPVPQLFGSAVVGFLATIVAIVLSVRAGAGPAEPGPRTRAVVVTANVVAVVAAMGIASEARDRVHYTGFQTAYYPSGAVETLTSPHGPVSNIYAFDAQGNPLTGVQLFDQHGNPLDVLLRQAPDGRYAEPVLAFGADGRPRGNVFPREYRVDDYDPATGRRGVVPAPRASFTAGPLAPSASPSPTAASPSASATPGSSPSAAPAPTATTSPGASPAASSPPRSPAPTP